MFVYIVPIFILLAGIVQYDLFGAKRGQKVVIGILFIYLTLMIGLRYAVGSDTLNYMGDYQWRVPLSEWTPNLLDRFQPGYVFLCALGKSISPEFYVFQLIHVILLNLLLFTFIYRNAEYKFSAYLCVYYLCYMNFAVEILRESLAVMIFLFNYNNLHEGKLWRYYLGVLLGCLFHVSSIFLVVLPFIKWVRFDKRYIYMMVIVVVGLMSLDKLFAVFESVPIISDKVSSYQDVSTGVMAGMFNLLRNAVMPLTFALLYKFGMNGKLKFETPVAIMTLAGLASFFVPLIFGRFVNYFIVFYALSFSDAMISLLKSGVVVLKKNAKILICAFCIVYFSSYAMYGAYQRFIPYYSIFNPIDVDRYPYD